MGIESLRDKRRTGILALEKIHEDTKTPFFVLTLFTALSLGAHCYVQTDQFELDQEKARAEKLKAASSLEPNLGPPSGSKVLNVVSADRMRPELEAKQATNKLRVSTASVGQGDDGTLLNLNMKNEAGCVVTGFRGVVYGFDAKGQPATMNKGGEKYAGFDAKDFSIEPGTTFVYSVPFRHTRNVSIALAQVDGFDCKK